MGELVHGGDHHFCSVNQLLHSATGENRVLGVWCWVSVVMYEVKPNCNRSDWVITGTGLDAYNSSSIKTKA